MSHNPAHPLLVLCTHTVDGNYLVQVFLTAWILFFGLQLQDRTNDVNYAESTGKPTGTFLVGVGV